MTVKAILATKGHEVTTIEPKASLADAAKLLSKHRIGAVIVMGADQRVAGMLSERDIVRALSEGGAAALDIGVEQVMTRRVVTCSEADTVGALMERMTSGKFRHLPVMEGGELMGLLSIGDLVKEAIVEQADLIRQLEHYIRGH